VTISGRMTVLPKTVVFFTVQNRWYSPSLVLTDFMLDPRVSSQTPVHNITADQIKLYCTHLYRSITDRR